MSIVVDITPRRDRDHCRLPRFLSRLHWPFRAVLPLIRLHLCRHVAFASPKRLLRSAAFLTPRRHAIDVLPAQQAAVAATQHRRIASPAIRCCRCSSLRTRTSTCVSSTLVPVRHRSSSRLVSSRLICASLHYVRSLTPVLATGASVGAMIAHPDAVTAVAVDPSGLYAASTGHDGSLRIWDIETKTCIQVRVVPTAAGAVRYQRCCYFCAIVAVVFCCCFCCDCVPARLRSCKRDRLIVVAPRRRNCRCTGRSSTSACMPSPSIPPCRCSPLPEPMPPPRCLPERCPDLGLSSRHRFRLVAAADAYA